MRLAICGCSPGETRYLCKCIQQYCARTGCSAEIFPIYDMEQFWQGFGPGRYHGVLMGLGDTAGFLAARRIREQDAGCRLVVMDDTPATPSSTCASMRQTSCSARRRRTASTGRSGG